MFKKLLAALCLLVLAGVATLAVLISYNTECPSPGQPASGADTMLSVSYRCYGPPQVLQLEQQALPVPANDEVLVKVEAAGINPLDWHYMRGSPYLLRLSSGLGAPDDSRLGVDFSGVVTAVGTDVTRFKPGDEVFGGGKGAFAQYLVIREDSALAHKPATLSFAQAASVPIAGLTALQALRDKGQVEAGDSVLINGASGGVGTFAVQVAKSMGADVTGICSTRNLELVRSLGADRVIDYKKEDYTSLPERYDLIVDMVGNHSPLANTGVLKPGGRYIMVGGATGDWVGPLLRPLQAAVVGPFVDEELIVLMALLKSEDLATLAAMMHKGEVTAVLDRHYALADVRDAISYSESGRARGKIILDIAGK